MVAWLRRPDMAPRDTAEALRSVATLQLTCIIYLSACSPAAPTTWLAGWGESTSWLAVNCEWQAVLVCWCAGVWCSWLGCLAGWCSTELVGSQVG
jgi:hypothetical protein